MCFAASCPQNKIHNLTAKKINPRSTPPPILKHPQKNNTQAHPGGGHSLLDPLSSGAPSYTPSHSPSSSSSSAASASAAADSLFSSSHAPTPHRGSHSFQMPERQERVSEEKMLVSGEGGYALHVWLKPPTRHTPATARNLTNPIQPHTTQPTNQYIIYIHT